MASPPTTSTRPLSSSVAVWPVREVLSERTWVKGLAVAAAAALSWKCTAVERSPPAVVTVTLYWPGTSEGTRTATERSV